MNNRFKRFRQFGAAVCAMAVTATLVSPAMLPEAAESTGETYYVDTANGNDSNAGLKGKPFKTIQKAANTVKAGDEVIIAAGDYRENVTFNVTGTKDKPIVFRADDGAEVAINATDAVTGTWTKVNHTTPVGTVQGDVYKIGTELTAGDKNQVFVNGVMQVLAQWPNRTGALVDETTISDTLMGDDFFAKTDSGTTVNTVKDAALPNVDLAGATLTSKGSIGWRGWVAPILSSAADRKSFTFENRSPYAEENMKEGVEYYVSNSLALLDAPGEWYYDEAKKELYICVPKGTKMADLTVEKKVRSASLMIEKSTYLTLENIDLFASEMTISGSASHCTIDGMKAEYLVHALRGDGAVSAGVRLDGTDNAIWNSEIAYSFAGGVVTGGERNKIINCKMHDMGYGNTGAGFISLYGEDEVIFHNTGYNAARSMIGGESQGARIAYNHFYNAGMLTKDCGLLYFGITDGGGMEIDHNVVHNNLTKSNSMGIYFDCGSQNYTIHHNLVYDINTYGFSMNVPSVNMLVFNNTIYDTAGSMDDWGHATLETYKQDQNGTYFVNNIVANNNPKDDKNHLCPLRLTDTAVQKTNIVTNLGEQNNNYAHPTAPSGYKADDAAWLFKDIKGDLAAGGLTLRESTDGLTPEQAKIVEQARTGGTAIRGVTGDDGTAAYIGCFDPDDETLWTKDAGYDEEGLDRTKTQFFSEEDPDEMLLDLNAPKTDIQYQNKVYNASFENGLTGWTMEDFDKTAVTIKTSSSPMTYGKGEAGGKEDTRSSKGAVRLGGGVDGLKQTVTGLKPNTQYRLSGWIKLAQGQTAAIGVENYNGAGDALEVKTSDANGGVWKRYSLEFTTGTNTSATVYLRTLTPGSTQAAFDDIGVQEAGAAYSEDFNDKNWDGATVPDNTVTYKPQLPTDRYALLENNNGTYYLGDYGNKLTMTFSGKIGLIEGESLQDSWRIWASENGGDSYSTCITFGKWSNKQLMVLHRKDSKEIKPEGATKTEAQVGEILQDPNFSFDDWHDYRIEADKAAGVKVYVDDVLVIEATDTENFGSGSGIFKRGYFKDGGKVTAAYDDLSITDGTTSYSEDFNDGVWNGATPKDGADKPLFEQITYPVKPAEKPEEPEENRYALLENNKGVYGLGDYGDKLTMTFSGKIGLTEGTSLQENWRFWASDDKGNTSSTGVMFGRWSNKQLMVLHRKNGSEIKPEGATKTEAQVGEILKDPSFSFDDWHDYRIEADKATGVKVYVDDVLVIEVTDTENFGTGTKMFRSGYFGTGGKVTAAYDDLSITDGTTSYSEDFNDGVWDGATPKDGVDKDLFKQITYPVNTDSAPVEPEKPEVPDEEEPVYKDWYAYLSSNGADLKLKDGYSNLSAGFKAMVENGALTLKLRQNSSLNDGLRIELATNTITVWKGNTKAGEKTGLDLSGWHDFSLNLNGGALRLSMDGEMLLELNDSGLAKYTGTGTAFHIAGAAGLDNLRIGGADSGTVPDKINYTPPVVDMDFPTLETREEFCDFEWGHWGGVETGTTGVIENSGNPDHNMVYRFNYNDWKAIRYIYPMHNASVYFDASLKPNDPNTGDKVGEGYLAVAARLFGESRYSFRILYNRVEIHKTSRAGTSSTLAKWEFPKGYDVSDWHNYRFLFDKNKLEVYVDVEKVISYVDEDQPLYNEKDNINMRLETRFVNGMMDNFGIAKTAAGTDPEDPSDPSDPGKPNNPSDPGNPSNPGGNGSSGEGGSGDETKIPDTGVALPVAAAVLTAAAGGTIVLLSQKRRSKK